MIGRCQQALYRGVLVALQQQNTCLQLDACLGHQAVRGKSSKESYSKTYRICGLSFCLGWAYIWWSGKPSAQFTCRCHGICINLQQSWCVAI